jgi:site-specific recombinase XerD
MEDINMLTQPELQDALQRFAIYLYAKCGSAEASVQLLTGFVRRAVPRLGLDPTPTDVERYIAELRQAKTSYGVVTNTITAMCHWMNFLGKPVSLARPRKPKQIVMGALTEAEIAIMIHAATSLRERTILTLLAYSGIRNNELCCLLVRDVDLSSQMVTIETAKGESQRRVCVSGKCSELLTEYLRQHDSLPEDRLFTTVRHKHKLATQDLRKIIRVAARRVDITKRVYPHLFRHSLATNMLHRGANLFTIKDQLGHAFIETTMVYLHSTQERLQADYRAFAPSYL